MSSRRQLGSSKEDLCLLAALQDGGKSCADLAAQLHLSYEAVRRRAAELRRARLLRIESYRKTAGRPRFVLTAVTPLGSA